MLEQLGRGGGCDLPAPPRRSAGQRSPLRGAWRDAVSGQRNPDSNVAAERPPQRRQGEHVEGELCERLPSAMKHGPNDWEYMRREEHIAGRTRNCIWTHPVAGEPVTIPTSAAKGAYRFGAGIMTAACGELRR